MQQTQLDSTPARVPEQSLVPPSAVPRASGSVHWRAAASLARARIRTEQPDLYARIGALVHDLGECYTGARLLEVQREHRELLRELRETEPVIRASLELSIGSARRRAMR